VNRFTKISATGLELPDDATAWAAVKDARLGLWWSLAETEPMTQPNGQKAAGALATAGFYDWRLPTLAELFALADHSRYSPAIDVAFFPKCKSAWYFTSTRAAYAPDGCAWVVYFADGATTWGDQQNLAQLRAVRTAS
jgi:Protein of unknown function (DUF1566)